MPLSQYECECPLWETGATATSAQRKLGVRLQAENKAVMSENFSFWESSNFWHSLEFFFTSWNLYILGKKISSFIFDPELFLAEKNPNVITYTPKYTEGIIVLI